MNVVVPVFFRWLITFNFVCLAWVFFRAGSLGTAGSVLGQLFAGRWPNHRDGRHSPGDPAGMAVQFIPA